MKMQIVIFLIGLILLYLQADARRFLLEAEVKKEKFTSAAAKDMKPNDQTGLAAGKKGSPVTGSVPAVDADTEEKNSEDDNANNTDDREDDKNDSYGTYGNPSGSSTLTHHVYYGCPPVHKSVAPSFLVVL